MNVRLLHISLLVMLLATGLTSLSARAECDQEELCEAQRAVTELLEDIVEQRSVIKSHWNLLDTRHSVNSLSDWYERTLCLVDVVSRYLHIGTLESQLLVAYNKLGAVKAEMVSHNPVCHCDEEIQLSARF